MLYPDSKIQPQSTSLVFIDAHLDNYQFLATGVVNDVEVIILDPTENGVDKITETLQQKITTQTKIEAIHIFSHGSPGNLQLGNTFLNLESLISAKQEIQKWKKALSQTANILLYGCNLAANIGGEFVNKLSQILEINIAASVDLTGSKLLGGNWNLGFTTGKIVAENPLKPEVIENYNSVFATLTVTNNNDDGAGSLRQAIATAQSGDTIEFAPSLANQTITLTSGQLEIDKDLIIDGVNTENLTISGNNNSRVIDLQFTPEFQSTSLTIKNLTIADGRTTAVDKEGAGAGIRTEQTSTLIVENSKFINNRAGGLGGGAIYSGFRSNATIINSQFENNDASQAIRNSSGQLSEHAGGAILIWSESNLTVTDSEFTNNKGVNGGAINNLLSNLTVENSTFTNNDSTLAKNTNHGYGGAIYTDGASNNDGVTSGTIKISNSSFDGNKGAGQGGGLFLFAYPPDKIIVENSEIINNQVISNSVGDALGGGLRVGNGELTINNTTIANNLALSQGGGLWVGENSPTEIINSTFSGNRAESEDGNSGLGGAISLTNRSNITNITNTTIANNYAGFQGGGFWGGNSNTTLKNTIVAYNVANNGGNDWNINHHTGTEFSDGGGNIQSNELNPNDTKVTAGVILTDPLLADLQEVDNIFIHPLLENSPAIDAGVNPDAPTKDQLGNNRPVDGDNNGSEITDVGAVEFITASPEPETGDNNNNILTVTNNNDSGTGSLRQAIADANPGDTIEFDASLANQTITLTSGQLKIGKDLTIDAVDAPGLTISGNNAHRVIETNFQTNVTIRNLTIANGSTTESGIPGSGGGIKTASQTTLTVENSTFENNVTSGQGGGAIWAGFRSNTTIINSKFDNNNSTARDAERGGGAVQTNGFAVLTIQDSEFTNNKGINGGAIHSGATALTIENSKFINNDSTAGAELPGSSSEPRGYGGAIFTDGVSASFGGDNGTIAIRNSHFEDNKGAGAGGAAFLFLYPGDNVVIENTNIINNSVLEDSTDRSQGGGIRLGTGRASDGRTSPATFTISNSTFAGNASAIEGGGLWIDRKLDLTRVDIVNSTFSENRAESADGTMGLGGAITTYAPTNITNTTITNNFAGEEAGAIYTNPSPNFTPDIQVKNTIFDRNSAGNVNESQQSNIQLIDQGGNLQYPAVGGDDELVTANIAIGDPNLADLQEVDGLLVHPLENDSAAIDAGVNTDAPNTDQLGNTRLVDGDNNGSEITDIGAVEFITPCITGDDSDNLIDGTSDDDCIHGLGGNDTLKGLAGNDTINGGDNNDTLGGGAGNDQLNGDAGNDSLTGWWGNDIIDGGDGFDILQGGDDADTLSGGNDADTLKGGTGNDLLNGDTGDDFIQGQADDDTLNGGDGQDTVGGGNGNDIVNGNIGNDSLTGWLGDDTLTGGTGNDTLQGGNGLDILNGEQGTDSLIGGSNSDRFIFDIGSQFNLTDIGSDIIKDFNSAESDKIVLSKTTFTSLGSVVGDGFSVAGEFAVVDSDAAAATSSAKIVYNSANGQLFYNPDGTTSGFGDGGLFATLENKANLQAEDFVLTSNSTPTPTPVPAEITSSVIKFTPSDTEAEIAAKGGPSIEIGTQTIYIGTWQESGNNQDPIIASFDETNPDNNWVRTDYESTGADGRGYGLFWDGDDLYAVFSTDGTQGSASEDFRRAATDATQSWLRSYGQGGGRKVSVVARIDELTGEMTDAAFFSARLNNGDSNTLTVTDLSINSDDNLVVEADAFFGPRNPDGSRMTQVDTSVDSPFDYTVEITQSLDEVISTAAVGWE